MVDKENQWDEDIDYTQDDLQNEEYEDYSEEDYAEGDEEYEDYEGYEDDLEPVEKKKANPLPLLLLALLLLGVAGFIFMNKMDGNKDVAANNDSQQVSIEQTATESQTGLEITPQEDLGDMFFEQAGGNASDMVSVNFNETEPGTAQVSSPADDGSAPIATVTESATTSNQTGSDLFGQGDFEIDPSLENNDIIISYDKASRENPFKPPVQSKTDLAHDPTVNNTQFEIIEPPTTSVPDENLTRLLQTQISGILYDEVSPSAIVSLNGVDSFVKVGDTISGYTIKNITEDKVQINYKSNSYVASVGELFVRGTLEKQRAVANLEKKFAGRYKENKLEE